MNLSSQMHALRRPFVMSSVWRIQVTDTTTFTDEKKRAEVDSWLYETCTQCLQHMVDVFVQFYASVHPLLPRILDLLSNFIRCASTPACLLSCPFCCHACQLPPLLTRSSPLHTLACVACHGCMTWLTGLQHTIASQLLRLLLPLQHGDRGVVKPPHALPPQPRIQVLLLWGRRPHQSLASVGVAALVQLVTSAGGTLDAPTWLEVVDMMAQSATTTVPALADLASIIARQAEGQVSSEAPVCHTGFLLVPVLKAGPASVLSGSLWRSG